jgi:uncharacterized protein
VSRVKAPVILLPPSEGKAQGGKRAPWGAAPHAFRELDTARIPVRDAVRRLLAGDRANAERLLGVRGRHLAEALTDWEALDDAPTMPAVQRYSGVVWAALDPTRLDPPARRRLNARVVVPSGLWGLAAASDPIPAYRLKMSARLSPMGALAAYWRPKITPIIDARARGGWVIDLLPNEHAAAVAFGALEVSRHLRVELLEDDGARRSVGHDGKSLKGLLARGILIADARTPDEVAAVHVSGLRCDGTEITAHDSTVVFRRTRGRADKRAAISSPGTGHASDE